MNVVSPRTVSTPLMSYSLWPVLALTRYLDDGDLPLDNNWVSKQIVVQNQVHELAHRRGDCIKGGSMSTATPGQDVGDHSTTARHAQVVPAFVVAELRRPLDGRSGPVLPIELLRWERKADLSEGARAHLRITIVRRLRSRAEKLWLQPVGVRLVEGWQQAIDRDVVLRLERLLESDDRPLELRSLREVKRGLQQPLETVFAALARLESLYWEPPPAAQLRATPPEPDLTLPRRLEAADLALARSVLALPWVKTVSAADLRFGYSSEKSLGAWIEDVLERQAAPGTFISLLHRLLAADRLTAAEELRQVAETAARECAPRSDAAAASRWVAMFMDRHLCPQGQDRTLAEVGDRYGVTRERVRQVCQGFEDLLGANVVATPALDRALLAASRFAPSPVGELDAELRHLIGDGAGIECLVAWTKLLGGDVVPIVCEKVRTSVRGQPIEITMVQRPGAPGWVDKMLRHVTRDSSMFGCSNVLRVAGRLALSDGVALDRESIDAALDATGDVRWLDKETGWFALGDTSECSAALRVKKLLAVARTTVGTDEITAALASDDMWMYREITTLGLATPPVHVMRELLRGWPWLQIVQKGRFVLAADFDASTVLTDVERACADAIEERDGVACRFELKQVVVEGMNFSDVLLAAVLGSSPIFLRLEHGLYTVRGRRVGDGALNAARHRLRSRAGVQADTAIEVGSNEFVIRVTEASLRTEQYSVPTRFHRQLCGARHAVTDDEGDVLGTARVSQAGALAGLKALFPEVQPGDHYIVGVHQDGLAVRHLGAQRGESTRS